MTFSSSWLHRLLLIVFAVLVLSGSVVTTQAASKASSKSETTPTETGPTRRAFVVGIQEYEDAGIVKLSRPVNDASDIADVLEDAGFDKKNIKISKNIKTKSDFMKALDDFAKSIKPGDEVVFFYSGHGYGSLKDDSNYILPGKIRSLYSFTKDKLQKSGDRISQEQAKDQAMVRLKAPEYETNFEIEEIQKSGISETEIVDMIAQKKPSTAVLILDACRTLATREATDAAAQRAGLHARLVKLPPGFAVIYSAADGESAIEAFSGFDQRRNSLFTDVLRTVIQRPGIDLTTMVRHLSAQVEAVAARHQLHQHPMMQANLTKPFRFVPSIGADRFPLPADAAPCFGAEDDLAHALDDRDAPEDRLITHINLFPRCPTAETARSRLATARRSAGRYRPPVGDCDDLAASPFDPSLRGRPGVLFERIGLMTPPPDHVPQAGEPDQFDTAWVVDVCAKAVKDNPRISRYMLNLARAEHAHARNPNVAEAERAEYLQRARADYETLANAGDPLAMTNLAQFYATGGDVPLPEAKRRSIDPRRALMLWGKAAQQGQPIAQYNLAMKYKNGWPEVDLVRDVGEMRHWMGSASRAGYLLATMEEAAFEKEGVGNNGKPNPARAVELYRRVVRQGGENARNAEYELGLIYLEGALVPASDTDGKDEGKSGKSTRSSGQLDPVSVQQDYEQALIWLGRAAAHGHAGATYSISYLLENARGISEPQQSLAARYLRAAAEAGFPKAQVKYVEKLLGGEMILRFENRSAAVDRLLKQAMASGNGKAALMLAQLAWPSDDRGVRDAERAAAYAFAAIDLAAVFDPSDPYFENEFSPLTEIAAGQFLVMLGHEASARDRNGQPLFSPSELATLEKFYGTYNEERRRVDVKIASIFDFYYFDPRQAPRRQIWLWDWGRKEASSEQQFRDLEFSRGTTFFDWYRDTYFRKERANSKVMLEHPEYITQNMVRDGIASVYKRAKNFKEPFLDLLGKKLELLSIR